MSAARIAVTKHTRTLSQPLRRSFYTPFAALQHSPLHAKPNGNKRNNKPAKTVAAHEHDHEHEHASRTLYVVSEPNAADFKYGVPAGAYPNAAPYHHSMPQHAQLENVSDYSSTSAHPGLICAALHGVAGVVGARRSANARVTMTGASGEGERPGPSLASDGEDETTMVKEDPRRAAARFAQSAADIRVLVWRGDGQTWSWRCMGTWKVN